MTVKNAELLAPAGNPEALDAAIGEGADAVYLGLKNFNARMRSGNFAYSQFEAATETLHKLGKKLYVTVNTVFEEREADRMFQFLQYLEKVGPDGIIVQDLGVVSMVEEYFPKLRLHASTQMNVGSAAGVNLLSRHGFKRVVLSRELGLEEIREVKLSSSAELEVFVHGALCVSASGICLFSSYLGGRSANRGACTQACRRLFRTENDKDGYFFSPNDLQLVDGLPDLVEAGVSSFKIEGRMKSAEYVGTVVAAYRYMLDNWRFDRERASVKAQAMLQSDFARRKTSFWFDSKVDPDFIKPEQAGGTGIALGRIKNMRVFKEKPWMHINEFAGIAEGDSLRIHRQGDAERITAKVRDVMTKTDGFFLQVDAEYGPGDEVYLVQTRSMQRKYKKILPESLERYHKFPSYDRAPVPVFEQKKKKKSDEYFTSGNYVLVSRVQDLHLLQSDRPHRAMIRLTRKNAEIMRRQEKELPFRGNDLVLWLEPYCPQADLEWLAEEIDFWIARGQTSFVANNIAHLSLLRGKAVHFVAGPWLYVFNSYAASFYLKAGAEAIMPPLEISKQNLSRISEIVGANAIFPVVLAWPALFFIRADMGACYDFRYFHDREGDDYELVNEPDGSVVIPAKPFSLVDRIPFLKKDGISRFLLDFSYIGLKKPVYRRAMNAARDATVLPETGRFNWKDGFWNPEEKGAQGKTSPKVQGRTPTGRAPGGRTTTGRAPGRERGRPSGKGWAKPDGRSQSRTSADGATRARGPADGARGERDSARRGSAERGTRIRGPASKASGRDSGKGRPGERGAHAPGTPRASRTPRDSRNPRTPRDAQSKRRENR